MLPAELGFNEIRHRYFFLRRTTNGMLFRMNERTTAALQNKFILLNEIFDVSMN
jgi:hypothetical protein